MGHETQAQNSCTVHDGFCDPEQVSTVKILQVSTSDVAGGAEQVARNLFRGYADAGHTSWMAVGEKLSDDARIAEIPNSAMQTAWQRRLDHLSRSSRSRTARLVWRALAAPSRTLRALRGEEDFEHPGTASLLELFPATPDLVQCHNLHGGYFDLRLLSGISARVPVVLTLHDAWLISGHCAHSFDCDRWRTGCGDCPYLETYPRLLRDGTRGNWIRKRDIFAGSRLYVSSPSRWLLQKVESSILAGAVIQSRLIPNGVDLSVFNSGDAREARRAVGVDPGTLLLLAVGNRIRTNEFKDYATLRSAVATVARSVPGRRVLCAVIGGAGPVEQAGSGEIRPVPPVGASDLVSWYRAADVFVHPARADTHPLTVLEAMASGAPVVATAVGGIPEQIEHGESGFLVPAADPDAMAAAIAELVRSDELRGRVAAAGVRRVRATFDVQGQVAAYLSWFEEILADRHGATA